VGNIEMHIESSLISQSMNFSVKFLGVGLPSFEVYNDLSGDVVNFFRVLRDRPMELIDAIELTPYSRLEFDLAYQDTEDELERARRLYIRSWQSYSSDAIAGSRVGWRLQYQKHQGFNNVVANFNRTDHLHFLAKRLKQVQIECDDAIAVIQRYGRNPRTLIYADPPYVHSTRTEKGNYLYEMTDEQHRELAEVLNSVEAMVLISGYDCELYRKLYQDWQLVQWTTLVNGVKRKATECLWISPNCDANKLPLFRLIQEER
jgi:DNA adenine methylase